MTESSVASALKQLSQVSVSKKATARAAGIVMSLRSCNGTVPFTALEHHQQEKLEDFEGEPLFAGHLPFLPAAVLPDPALP